jgi:tetratricopeptide (TPR) repeat protein
MYRRAIALNPNYAPAHHWLSSLTEARGRLPEALRLAEKAVELDPLSAIANGHRASVLSTLARFEDARAGFARAIRIDPGLATAYHEVGLMHGFSFGELDEAVPWLEKAVRLDPTDPNNLMRLFMFYRQLGQDAEARRCLDRALEGAPQNSFVNAIAAVALYERGDTAAAREFAQKAAVNPRRIWLLRDDDLRKGDYAIARDRYSKAFPGLLTGAAPELTWNDFDSAIDLALVLQHTGERKRATNLLDRAEAYVRQFPRRGADGQGVGLYLIEEASIHALRGDKPRSLALLREAGHAGWWRRTLSYHRDLDPNLESIRHEPEFKAIFANIEREMARQRTKLAARPENVPLDGLEVRRPVN